MEYGERIPLACGGNAKERDNDHFDLLDISQVWCPSAKSNVQQVRNKLTSSVKIYSLSYEEYKWMYLILSIINVIFGCLVGIVEASQTWFKGSQFETINLWELIEFGVCSARLVSSYSQGGLFYALSCNFEIHK